MYWKKIDTGHVLVDETKDFGYRTKAIIQRVCVWGDPPDVVRQLVKVKDMPTGVLFDDRDEALKYTEVVVALKGDRK